MFQTSFIESRCGTFGVIQILVASETQYIRKYRFDICEVRNLTFLCKGDHPSFATCMYMLERAVSIFVTIDFD